MNSADHQLHYQADKAIASASGGFGWFSSKSDKYENAVDLYQRAANAFRMQKAGAPTSFPSTSCLLWLSHPSFPTSHNMLRQGSRHGI